jgi:hypothetical protein
VVQKAELLHRTHVKRGVSKEIGWAILIGVATVTIALGQAPGTVGTEAGGGTSTGSGAGQTTTAPQQGDQSYQGSVPQGTALETPIPLTLNDAIYRGLKANLGLLTNEQSSLEVRAERLRALSGLLPKVTGQLNMTEQQINLQALV